jgi:phosphoribosylformylglycinamidine cyclo-ligase
MGDIGGFGGLFDLAKTGYTDPLLVSATDGVGTKAEIARMTGRFDTIGQDLVAMCVDDLICVGAAPLFFLDYVAVGQLVPEVMEQLVAGIANGCRTAGCALIGGEMAEHPGVMETAQFDLVGFAVGAVERSKVLDGSQVAAGDVLVALESPNLRSNGFSLARRIVFEVAECSLGEPAWEGAETTLADELLAPSVIYAPTVGAVLAEHEVHAVAHITGGGLIGNLPRVMGTKVDALVDAKAWTPPRFFAELQAMGGISDEEMGRVFNMGVGMVLVVPQSQADGVLNTLADQGQRASIIGQLVDGSGCVTFDR